MEQRAAVDEDLTTMLAAAGNRCRVWPEQDEGPYHRAVEPYRQDVVEDCDGKALRLGIGLVTPDGATPIAGARVEIWQCDASGRYSGFPPPNSGMVVTSQSADRTVIAAGETFLRGRQLTDATGRCQFNTIVPGWYPGRTLHIHVIAHVDKQAFISQLYFPDKFSESILATPPYEGRGARDTTNATDDIYPTAGGSALLDPRPDGAGFCAAVCFILGERPA